MAEKGKISYMQPSESYFVVPGVSYRGETGTWNVFEKMVSPMTQDKLAEYSEKEKQKGNPHLMDLPLHFEVALAAYKLREGQDAEKLRGFLQSSLGKYSNTLTRIAYNPDGNDEVIHNYGTSDQYPLSGNIVGPDQWIENMEDKKTLELLLGTKDVKKINNVFQWINNTNGYIWRVNSKPSQQIERVVGLDASDVRLVLYCLGNLGSECPAVRVLRVE